jgi:mRNA interferase MazF
MGSPAIGDVVLVPFPYSDLTGFKRRPALVVASADRGDVVMCQITSRAYADSSAIAIGDDSFTAGGLSRPSFVRAGKLFTGSASLVLKTLGTLDESTNHRIRESLRAMFVD